MVSPVMPKVGLEPTRPSSGTGFLSPARLPFRHFGLSTQDRSPTTRATATSAVAERAEKADTSALAPGRASSTKEEGLLRKKPLLAIVPIAAAAVGLSIAVASGKTGPAVQQAAVVVL